MTARAYFTPLLGIFFVDRPDQLQFSMLVERARWMRLFSEDDVVMAT